MPSRPASAPWADSCRSGARRCSIPIRRCRPSPSCDDHLSRFSWNPHPPGARRGRGTRTWGRSRARRGGCSRDGTVHDWTPDRGWHGERRPADPLAELQGMIARDAPAAVPELGDFWAGAVGYFAYDVVRHIERLPDPPQARPRRARRALRVHARGGHHRQPACARSCRGRCPGPGRRRRRDAGAPVRIRGRRSRAHARAAARSRATPRARLEPARAARDGTIDVREGALPAGRHADSRVHPGG